ncbi:MAG: hypothetical protein ACI35Z_06010 [Sphingobacterium hotanense]
MKKDYLNNASSGYQTYRKELAEEAYTERGRSNMWGTTLLPSDTTGVVLNKYSESIKRAGKVGNAVNNLESVIESTRSRIENLLKNNINNFNRNNR